MADIDPSTEIWKPIPTWEGIYEVSSFGQVRRISSEGRAQVGRILRPKPDKRSGFAVIVLLRKPRIEPTRLHHLVLRTFVGECPWAHKAKHRSGDKTDNSLANLEYARCDQIPEHITARFRTIARGDRTIIAYAAGLFDGEGNIVIGVSRSKRKRRHEMAVCVTNTNKNVIQWMFEMFGGRVQINSQCIDGRKVSYRWGVGANQAACFLELVLPYLKIKKQQAEIAIEYQAHVRQFSNWKVAVPEDELLFRDMFSDKLRALIGSGRIIHGRPPVPPSSS